MQREVAPETSRQHWQGYIELASAMTLRAIIDRVFNGCTNIHIETRRGLPHQASQYCKKTETRANPAEEPIEWGTMRDAQGTRSDLIPLQDITRQIITGAITVSEVAEENPEIVVRHHRGLMFLQNIYHERTSRKWRDVDVTVIWGDTGTGKSAFVDEWCATNNRSLYRQPCELKGTTQWWDGLTPQHDTIAIEEFTGYDCMTLTTLLQVLDGHQCRVQVKGAFTYITADTIFILSNIDPMQWYPGEPIERHEALMRRIKTIHHYVAAPELRQSYRQAIQTTRTITRADIENLRLRARRRTAPPLPQTLPQAEVLIADTATLAERSAVRHVSRATRPTTANHMALARINDEWMSEDELFDEIAIAVHDELQPRGFNANLLQESDSE